jgi:hypothetical protein
MPHNYTQLDALSDEDKEALAAAFNFLSAEYLFYATLVFLAIASVITIRTLITAYREEDALQSIAKTMRDAELRAAREAVAFKQMQETAMKVLTQFVNNGGASIFTDVEESAARAAKVDAERYAAEAALGEDAAMYCSMWAKRNAVHDAAKVDGEKK